MAEWYVLGACLRILCPDKFDEILDALRDTVGVHQILAPESWNLSSNDQSQLPPSKA